MKKVVLNKKNTVLKSRSSASGKFIVKKEKLTKEEKYLIENVGNAIKRLSRT